MREAILALLALAWLYIAARLVTRAVIRTIREKKEPIE